MAEIDHVWEVLIKRYKPGRPIPFDFKAEVIKLLGKNSPNNYPHYIHYYPGRIFPYIPLFILSSKVLCPHEGIVLDPFSGSGTVLLESIINPVYKRDVFGIEINPLGRLISKVKTTPLETESAREILKQITHYYRNAQQSSLPPEPIFKNKSVWFSERATKRLTRLKHSISKVNASQDLKDFFWVCFSSIVRKVSKADPFIPPPVVLKKWKYKESPRKYDRIKSFLKTAEDPNVLGLFKDAVEKNMKSIASLNNIEEINKKGVAATLIWDDARDIKKSKIGERGVLLKENDIQPMDSDAVDLIVTSPPYLAAQKYIRTHKLELFWLELLEEELLELDKNSIGTEKVPVRKIDFAEKIGVKSIDCLIKWSHKISPERAAVIYKYFHDMHKAVSEMHRVLKKGGYAVVILGNNTVLKREVKTYKLLSDLGKSVGFKEVLVLKDDIRGRGMITRRNNSGGLIKDEYVIIWQKRMS